MQKCNEKAAQITRASKFLFEMQMVKSCFSKGMVEAPVQVANEEVSQSTFHRRGGARVEDSSNQVLLCLSQSRTPVWLIKIIPCRDRFTFHLAGRRVIFTLAISRPSNRQKRIPRSDNYLHNRQSLIIETKGLQETSGIQGVGSPGISSPSSEAC